MSSDATVDVCGVSKSYRLYETPFHRMMELLFGGARFSLFHALKATNIIVKKGETLGIMGRNGSGKSTLLQLIAGTLTPSEGKVTLNGRVAALLELGSGFNPDFTGRENVLLYASIMGMTRKEIEARLNDILEFADIGPFIDRPIKTYSSGMTVRLAFATVAHLDPDVLIVDEALAVGDAQFQMKCMQRVNALRSQGKTFLLASHSPDLIVSFCSRAIVLEHGNVVFDGAPKDAVHIYKALLFPGGRATKDKAIENSGSNSTAVTPVKSLVTHLSKSERRYGNGDVKIERFELLTQDGQRTNVIATQEAVRIRLCVKASRLINQPVYGIRVRNVRGLDVYIKNTLHERITCPPLRPNIEEIVEVPFVAALVGGEYFLSAGVVEFVNGEQTILDRRLDAVQVSVIGIDGSTGMANLGARFEVGSLAGKH